MHGFVGRFTCAMPWRLLAVSLVVCLFLVAPSGAKASLCAGIKDARPLALDDLDLAFESGSARAIANDLLNPYGKADAAALLKVTKHINAAIGSDRPARCFVLMQKYISETFFVEAATYQFKGASISYFVGLGFDGTEWRIIATHVSSDFKKIYQFLR